MDELDYAIIRNTLHPELFQWNVRVSRAEIARAVGVDEETVRLRMRRMEDDGIVKGWQVLVNPSVFGRAWVRFQLPPTPPESRAKIASALGSLDGANLIIESLAGDLELVCYQESGPALERQKAVLGVIAGGEVIATPMRLAPATVELSALDWRIVQALRYRPRVPYEELALELDASERTIRRRVDRLVEGHALILDAEVDFSRINGSLTCALIVELSDETRRAAVTEALEALSNVVFRQLHGPILRVAFATPNVAGAEDSRRRVEDAAAGSAPVRLQLMLRRDLVRSWLDAEIAKRALAS